MTQTLEVYSVSADRQTGEWLGAPESTGEVTTATEWCKLSDTNEEHYDTYVYDHDTQAERALIVQWVP